MRALEHHSPQHRDFSSCLSTAISVAVACGTRVRWPTLGICPRGSWRTRSRTSWISSKGVHVGAHLEHQSARRRQLIPAHRH